MTDSNRILGFIGDVPIGRDVLGRPKTIIRAHQIMTMPAANAGELLRDRHVCDLTAGPLDKIYGTVVPRPMVRRYEPFRWDYKAVQLGKPRPPIDDSGSGYAAPYGVFS